MANLDAVFDFMFTKPKKMTGESAVDKKEILYFADVCAGPGGFSEYILYRKGWRAKGMFYHIVIRNKMFGQISKDSYYKSTMFTFIMNYML